MYCEIKEKALIQMEMEAAAQETSRTARSKKPREVYKPGKIFDHHDVLGMLEEDE